MNEELLYSGAIEDGAMIDAPIYESHKRGRNWMAVIAPDPAAPGGVARKFVMRGHGRYYYIVGRDLIGKAVEFGADYYSSSGRKKSCRWYGVVLTLTDSRIAIQQYEEAYRAIDTTRTVEMADLLGGCTGPTRFENIELQPASEPPSESVKTREQLREQLRQFELRQFVRWLYREEGITFSLQNSNHDDLDERAAIAQADRFLMDPQDLKREQELMDRILQRDIEELRKQGRYHD